MVPTDRAPRVLVVDDEATLAAILAEHLADGGYEARVAYGGAEALEAARRDPPDVVLTDIRMPGLDGFGLADALRREGVRCGIVFMTAYEDLRACMRAWDLGADGFLRKPLSLPRLDRVVAEAVARRAR